jgi:hypothetical protein
MASSFNPYDEGVYDQPVQPPVSGPNPYDVLPTPIGPDTSVVTKAADAPYSTFNTVGRMATDALFGLPDTANMAARGLNYGIDWALGKAGLPTPSKDYDAIPYVAPIARKAAGVAELPEDAGWKRALAEGGGSMLIGGLGSAAGRGIVRGAKAIPEMAAVLNPWKPVRNITESALEKSGDDWYKALEKMDVRYTPQTGPHMADAINRGAFKPRGISDANAGQAISNVEQLRTIDPAANVPYGTTKNYVVPRDIEDVRQALNRTRSQAFGLPGHREGEAANVAIGGIDRFFENPPKSAIHPTNLNDPTLVGPVLANARGDTAAAHRLGFLEGTRDEIGTKFAAKPTASASSEAQALRDRAAAALNASREGGGPLYGFNDYEKQLLEKTATASWLARYGANAPKSLIGTIGQGGGIGASAYFAGAPHSVSAALAAGVPISEYTAKKLADWGTRRSYQRAADEIAARSPLAQGMGIPAPPTARVPRPPSGLRDDIAAALMAPSILRQEQP